MFKAGKPYKRGVMAELGLALSYTPLFESVGKMGNEEKFISNGNRQSIFYQKDKRRCINSKGCILYTFHMGMTL